MQVQRRFSIILGAAFLLIFAIFFGSRAMILKYTSELRSTTVTEIETMVDQSLSREQETLFEMAVLLSVTSDTTGRVSQLLNRMRDIDYVAEWSSGLEVRCLYSRSDLLATQLSNRMASIRAGAQGGFILSGQSLIQIAAVRRNMDYADSPETYSVVAKVWDVDVLNRISNALQAKISVISVNEYMPVVQTVPTKIIVRRPLASPSGEIVAFLEIATGLSKLDRVLTSYIDYMWVTATGTAIILVGIGFFVFRWVAQPLRIINQSLSREVVGDMHFLQQYTSEFGLIAKRLTKFFVQRSALLKELEWHQKTERALTQSEQDYRELFERAHDAILIIDSANQIIISANAGAHTIYGVPPDSLPGQPFSTLWPDESLREKLLKQTTTRGSVQGWEAALRKPDGRDLVLEVSSTTVDYQRRAAIMCIARDITDRKYYEELRLSQTILRQVNNLIIVGNGSGRIIYVNHAVTTLTGYTRAELLGQGWWNMTRDDEESRNTEMDYISAASKGLRPTYKDPYDRIIRCKDGNQVWIQWYDTKGPEDLIIGVGIDITAQKAALQALEESEEHYRLLFDNNPSSIIMYDAKSFEIIDVNPASCNLYGYSREEFQKLLLGDLISREGLGTHQDSKSDESTSKTTRHRRKNGSLIDVEVVDHALEYKNRETRIAMIQELSERKRAELAELELRTQKVRLATVVHTQEEERRRIARELHDGLGQMLAALKRSLEYTGYTNSQTEDDSSAQLLDNAIGETRRIAHNLMPSALEDLGLFAALDRLCYQCFHQTDIQIHFQTYNFDERLPAGSELNVYRIVQEAFNNILKHANAKEVTLQIVGYADKWILTIEDDGAGFDATAVSQKRSGKGGLGLVSLRERVEFLGGELEINSAPGQGTSLVIEIPISIQVEHV